MQIDIINYLQNLNPQDKLYIYPNPGNAGDCVIMTATMQIFDTIGLSYEIIHNEFDPKNKVIMYGGGGNMIEHYVNARDFIHKNHGQAKKLIILPHTIHHHHDVLQELQSNVDIITREHLSYQYVQKYATKSNVYLAHDLAFYMDVEKIQSFRNISFSSIIFKKIQYRLINHALKESIPSPKKIVNNKFIELHAYINRLFQGKNNVELNSFRIDAEKTNIAIPKRNFDLSEMYKFGTFDKNIILYSASKLIRFIKNYDIIKTNRLHIAITGILLNKKVIFYPNNYFKNKAIYEHSIKGYYPNIKWVDYDH